MPCRHMYVCFEKGGHVEYQFHKHHAKYLTSSYTITYPPHLIDLIDEHHLNKHNFQKRDSGGDLRLTWDKVLGDEARIIHYRKRDKLLSLEDGYHRYEEEFTVKGSSNSEHQFCIHRPHDKISAMKYRSQTRFIPHSSGELRMIGREGVYVQRAQTGIPILLQCCDVADIVFRCSGKLLLNWILEGVD